MADYKNIKTPYFDIEIMDPSGNKKVSLPRHILQLVNKVEILESLNSSQPNSITIEILEGSREPAGNDPKLGTSGLYKLDNSVGGSITNRTGAITDLRFSGNRGITFFNERERELGKLDRSQQVNIDGKKVRRTHPGESGAPIFLFQERNLVKITWGYREDPKTFRSVMGRIVMFTTDFPENGAIKSTITASSTEVFLDQIAPTKGIKFGNTIKTGAGNNIITFEDQSTEEMLRDICDKVGIDCIISEDLPAGKTERDKTKLMVAGQSMKQFLDELSRRHNSYWRMLPNPKSGKDTLIFLKKQDLESELIINDPVLFSYKSPGSIIKNIRIQADFGGFGNSSQVGSDESGEVKSSTTDVSTDRTLFESTEGGKIEEIINLDPTKDVAVCRDITDVLFQGDYASKVETTPNEGDASVDEDVASAESEDNSRILSLEMTTMGFTQIIPGTIEIKNIGARYSGKYRIQAVTHSITDRGYFTKVQATSFATAKGGIRPPEPEIGNVPPERVDRQLFTPRREEEALQENARGKQIFKEYKRFLTNKSS